MGKKYLGEMMKDIPLDRNTLIIAPTGSGKAQPLDSLLLTEGGFVKMGDVKVDDKIFGEDGKPHTVTGVFPQGEKDIYEIELNDGSKVRCCGEHLWTYQTVDDRVNKKYRTTTLYEIMKKKLYKTTIEGHRRWQIYLPMTKPVQFKEKDVKLDSWLMGVLLGDGCFKERNSPSFSNTETDILCKVSELVESIDMELHKRPNSCDYMIVNKEGKKNKLNIILEEYGLISKKSYDKFIPNDYLYNTVEVRLEILRGLIDTDGNVQKNGVIEFSSSSEQLVKDVQFLVQSLGGTAKISSRIPKYTYKGEKRQGRMSYRIRINPPKTLLFHTSQKHSSKIEINRQRDSYRQIKNIAYIGKEICQCIMVDNPTHLYLTDGFVVTHNTHFILNDLCKDKKVLYLCDNSNLEEQVSLEDYTKVAKSDLVKKGFGSTEITIMTYKYFGTKIKFDMKNELINGFDLVVADEIHNLVDYQTFNDDADLSHAFKVLMGTYENTPIIMFTATPYYLDRLVEKNGALSKCFYRVDFSKDKEIMRYINKRECYLNHISQIQFALKEYSQAFEYGEMKCLIYVNKIKDMKFIQDMCEDRKLKPICLWSIHNEKHFMTLEQKEVRNHLLSTGELLSPYNVLVINRAMETGVNIYDNKIQLVIVDTVNITQQIQARGRVRHDVDLLVVKTKNKNQVDAITVDENLLNTWLLKHDLENMIRMYNLRDVNKGRYLSVAKLCEYLSQRGHRVSKNRKMIGGNRNIMYMIEKDEK